MQAVLGDPTGGIVGEEEVQEQREHREDDADRRGQLELAFEEHLIVSSLSLGSKS